MPASALRLFLNLLPRTNADKQSAVTLLLAICQRLTDAPAQWGLAVSEARRMPRRSVAGVLGASAGVLTTRSGAASWLPFESARIAYTVALRRNFRGRIWRRRQMRSCGRQPF